VIGQSPLTYANAGFSSAEGSPRWRGLVAPKGQSPSFTPFVVEKYGDRAKPAHLIINSKMKAPPGAS